MLTEKQAEKLLMEKVKELEKIKKEKDPIKCGVDLIATLIEIKVIADLAEDGKKKKKQNRKKK